MDESGQVSDTLLSMLSDNNFEEVDRTGDRTDDNNEECDDVFELPEHEFVHGTIVGKSGNKGGVKRSKVNYFLIRGQCLVSLSLQITLFMGPYQFRKRSTRSNGIIQFTCVSCESEHRKSAMAQMSYDDASLCRPTSKQLAVIYQQQLKHQMQLMKKEMFSSILSLDRRM